MDRRKMNKKKIIFVAAFIALHIISGYLITSDLIFPDINPYPRTFFMIINSFFGDFGFIMMFLGLAILIFRTDYKRAKFLMITTIVFCITYVGLSVYVFYYKTFFSFYNLQTFGTGTGGEAMLFLLKALPGLLVKAKYIFLIPAAIMITLYILFFFRNRKVEEVRHASVITGLNRVYIGILTLAIGLLMMGNSLSAYIVDVDETWYEENATPIYGIQSTGLFNYYIYDAYSFLFTDEVYPEEKKREIIERLKEFENRDRISPIDGKLYGDSPYGGIFAGKNLVLIQMESVNNFVIGLSIDINGEQVEVTPNLNRILANSVYFNQYYHSVGIGNTSDAEFTALIGINPVGKNLTVSSYFNEGYETLPKLFREKGYSSFSMHANSGAFYERGRTHPGMYGFDIHYSTEILDIQPDQLLHTFLNDADMFRQVVDHMADRVADGPVFAYPITISNHTPYNKPFESDENWFPEKENLFPKDFKLVSSLISNTQYTGYLEHVAYTDYAIGVLFECLEEKGLTDDTIVILYGDHGCGIDIFEMFSENPELFHNEINDVAIDTDSQLERRLLQRRFLQNIPFIIYDPSGEIIKEDGILPPQIISKVRGTNCTARTIANLFGLDAKYHFGVDALSDAVTFAYSPRNHDIYVDGMIISGQSEDFCIFDDAYADIYDEAKRKEIIEIFHDYKDFNDKLLKYKIFPLDEG